MISGGYLVIQWLLILHNMVFEMLEGLVSIFHCINVKRRGEDLKNNFARCGWEIYMEVSVNRNIQKK